MSLYLVFRMVEFSVGGLVLGMFMKLVRLLVMVVVDLLVMLFLWVRFGLWKCIWLLIMLGSS